MPIIDRSPTAPTVSEFGAANADILIRDNTGDLYVLNRDGAVVKVGPTNADGSTFVQSGTGAISRTVQAKLRDTVSVKDFGALGDDSNDDTAEIQAALDSGAKRVFAPAGTYKISTALSVPAGVEFYGEGIGSIIKGYANIKLITVAGVSNAVIRDLKLDGQRATYTTSSNDGIYVNWVTTAGANVKIRNVTVRDVSGAGIIALASSGQASTDLVIEGNDVQDCGAHGIIAQDYISNVTVTGNTVKNTALGTSNRPGITASRSGGRVVVSNNICIGSASALGSSTHGISFDQCSNVTCNGNVCDNWPGYGIEIGGVTNGSFTGNVCDNTDVGGIVLAGSNNSFRNINVSVTGNTINNNNGRGIYSTMASGAAAYLHQNIVIANNTVNATQDQAGIEMTFCERLSVVGNSAYGCYLSGIYLLDCKNMVVSGNNVINNNCASVKTISSLTLSGSTATATSAGHGYSNSDVVTIFGAVPVEYNGSYTISNVAADTFDYTTNSGLTSPAVGTIECTKSNSTSHGGIRVQWSAITTKETCVFGPNLVYRNGFREIYDTGAGGFIGFVNDCLFLKEAKEPAAANLTSGEASNEQDRIAIFMNNNKFAIAYNNAGTNNYVVLDLDGSDTTWANGATAP